MNSMPMVIKRSGATERAYDLTSLLHTERTIFVCQQVDEHLANVIVQQLLDLSSGEHGHKDIHMYINSPGGAVIHGLAIYDTMRFIKAKVHTYCIGQCASMGAFLLSGGTGVRYALPSSRIMIHQPSGGYQGQATDIEIHTKETIFTKRKLTYLMSKHCKQDYATVHRACERDNYMSPQEALEFGLIDKIAELQHPVDDMPAFDDPFWDF